MNNPASVVLTESSAKKYFGKEDPLGKTINYRNFVDLKVTGVINDVPENSHFKYDFLGSFITLYDSNAIGRKTLETNWSSNNYLTYILLPEKFPIKELESKVDGFIDEHYGQVYLENKVPLPPKGIHSTTTLHFQKLTDIHLHSHLTTEIEENGDITNVYIFSAIAFFVMMIACINFMNLSTARSSKRAREIGVRKVLGAFKNQLIKQFIGESMLTVFLSLILAVIIVGAALIPFSNFTQRNLKMNLFSDPLLLLGIVALAILVGFISGSYPALLLSSFKPVSVLKGENKNSWKSNFRTVLVVLQFTISICLIIAVSVVYNQLQFIKNTNLGYNKDHLVILPGSKQIKNNLESFKGQLLQNQNIKMVTTSRLVPSNMLLNSMGTTVFDGDKKIQVSFRVAMQEVDYDFLKTYQIKLSAGRDFSKEFATDDSLAFILNETAIRKLGWTAEQAIGKSINYGYRKGKIIGVVQDFNFETLHNEIVPIIFFITKTGNNQVTVRISGNDIPATLNFLKSKWKEYRADYPFDYNFLDDQLAGLYDKDQKSGDVFGIFAIIAAIIACLGLFGLSSFIAEVRTKEIGIRKVLGAKVSGIVFLLSKEFMLLILIANIIAWPLSYYFMNNWLSDFAYKIGISIWIFFGAGIAALLIALITVGTHAFKAATANPVEALRYE